MSTQAAAAAAAGRRQQQQDTGSLSPAPYRQQLPSPQLPFQDLLPAGTGLAWELSAELPLPGDPRPWGLQLHLEPRLQAGTAAGLRCLCVQVPAHAGLGAQGRVLQGALAGLAACVGPRRR